MDEISAGDLSRGVEGVESGHCTARIEVRIGPGGCRIVDYEATSDKHGLQHIEHGLLTANTLHVAFGEAPGVTTFHAIGEGMYESIGGPPMQTRVSCTSEVLTGGAPSVLRRSREVVRLRNAVEVRFKV